MYRSRRWIVAPPHEGARALADRLRTSAITAQMLLNRGISDPDDCTQFLKPSLKCLHDPDLIPNLTLASQRVAHAIREKEKVVIYGDYDVDGITAVAILWHAIKTLGGVVEYYVPHRIEEGYGLNAEAIAQICDAGAKLIISVDCGITAVGPAKVARDKGVDLIITDHHEWQEAKGAASGEGQGASAEAHSIQLPDCYATVHPRLPRPTPSPSTLGEGRGEGQAPAELTYPNPHLCGAGVAFKLAWGIGKTMTGANRVSDEFRQFLVEATALAALGTIADVVPLIGENRVLASFGLNGLRASKLNGIRALIKSAKLDGQNIDCYHVGFLLAPRLNASGRMGHANLAVQMLTDADPAKAEEIAIYLESQNRARQTMEKKIVQEAIEQIETNGYASEENRAIVLGGEGWHPGVIGIVASRIVDKFARPVFVVALNNGIGQGSGRSISGFHLSHALEACGEHLESFGGHEMAAGLKVRTENFEAFRAAFVEYANRTIDPVLLIPELRIDAVAEIPHMSEALVNEMKRLGPFGHGNRKPILCCKGVTLTGQAKRVGKTGDHLQLFIRQGNARMKCIAFGAGDLFDQLTEGTTLDLAVEPQINEFNGRVSVELMVKDLQFL